MQLLRGLLHLARNISKMTLLLLACILINAIVIGDAFPDIKQQPSDVLMPGATVSMPGIPSYSFINPVFADINEAFFVAVPLCTH